MKFQQPEFEQCEKTTLQTIQWNCHRRDAGEVWHLRLWTGCLDGPQKHKSATKQRTVDISQRVLRSLERSWRCGEAQGSARRFTKDGCLVCVSEFTERTTLVFVWLGDSTVSTLFFWNGGAVFNGQPKAKRPLNWKVKPNHEVSGLQDFLLYFQWGVNRPWPSFWLASQIENNRGLQFFVKFTGFRPYFSRICSV